MKLAFSANAFRNYSLMETMSIVKEAGYDGVEIMCDAPHAYPPHLSVDDRKKIKERLAQNCLDISNLNAFMLCAIQDFHHPSWIEPDENYRRLRVQHTLDCILLASDFGARCLSTEPGGPLGDMDYETALELFCEGLSEVIPIARARGVRLLIEPEPGLLIENSRQFLSFLDRLGGNADVIGLNFDIGHFYCVGEDPLEKIRELREYIFHFHLEDVPLDRRHEHIMLGEGALDIPGILDAIEKTGYDGYVTVELYPYQDSAELTAHAARDYLRRVCGYE